MKLIQKVILLFSYDYYSYYGLMYLVKLKFKFSLLKSL